jgi:hypothetical protein
MKNHLLNTLGITIGFLISETLGGAHEGEHHVASHEMGEHHAHEAHQETTIKVEVLPQEQIQKNKSFTTRIKLISTKDHKEILLTDLEEVHTKKIHVLIFDQTLTDYQHVHPTATKEPGVYKFSWIPKNDGTYKLWVNIVPLKTGKEEYISTVLATVGSHRQLTEKRLNLDERVGNNLYSLTFGTKELKMGKAYLGRITIRDHQGKAVNYLEPIMGAFAHIVAINEDFNTIAHVHPMGKEPTIDIERGGPELDFHFMPEKKGFYKLWLQVQLDGKDVFIPFGIKVE